MNSLYDCRAEVQVFSLGDRFPALFLLLRPIFCCSMSVRCELSHFNSGSMQVHSSMSCEYVETSIFLSRGCYFFFPLVEEDVEQSVDGPDDIILMGLVIKK